MGSKRGAGLVVALAACVVAAGAQATQPRGTSDNWSGYVTFGQKFKTVRGSWVQPSAQCFQRATSYTSSAFWVGLGGNELSSHKIEQIGTEADCDTDGTPDYFAWYELWPADSNPIDRIEVLPGDRINAEVDIGRSSVRFVLHDVTGGQGFDTTFSMRKPDGSSAEWIAEAPAQPVRHGNPIIALTDFGTVHFSGASATSFGGHHGGISDHAWRDQAIDFKSDRGSSHNPITSFLDSASAAHGFPSGLTGAGSAFTITWKHGLHTAGKSTVAPGAA